MKNGYQAGYTKPLSQSCCFSFCESIEDLQKRVTDLNSLRKQLLHEPSYTNTDILNIDQFETKATAVITDQMKALIQQERNPISPISLISNSEENLPTHLSPPDLTLTSCESLKPNELKATLKN